MSENIEKQYRQKNHLRLRNLKLAHLLATDNVVLYPVADISPLRRKLQTLKRLLLRKLPTPRTQIIKQLSTAKLPTVKLPITQTNSVTPEIQKNFRKKDAEEDEDLEEDFFTNNRKNPLKDEHPFREFFSNFRSKRKIEMNRDEQILSRISDEDLMEYLRMEQKRMELLQQAKRSPRKKILDHIPALYLSVICVILVIYFLKDNPVILVSILYTVGILTALRIWSKSQNGKDHRDKKDSSDYHKKPWE